MPPTQNTQQMPQGVPARVIPGHASDPYLEQSQQAQYGDAPITEEQKQIMKDLVAKIKTEMEHMKATKFASDGQTEAYRNEMLQQVFSQMEAAGIDLSSRESVNGFLEKLKQENPELAMMFENSMEVLLGGRASTASIEGNTPPLPGSEQNNMNIPNENQPQAQPELG